MSKVREDLLNAKSVRDLWNVYLRNILPANAHPVQVTETRRAFYAGADALMKFIMLSLDSDQDTSKEDLALMVRIEEELVAFAEQVAKGAA